MNRGTVLATIAWAGLLLAACSSLELIRPTAQVTTPVRIETKTAPLRLTQHGFGSAAAFVHCKANDCPTPTAKTLAADAAPRSEVHDTAPAPRSAPPTVIRTPQAHAQAASDTVADDPLPLTVTVTFSVGSAELSTSARSAIDRAVVATRPVRQVQVLGLTDATGPAALNEALARARADAVVQHLRRRHTDLVDKTTIDSRGRCCYVASNDTPAGRASNRRAEVTLEPEADAP